MITVVHNDSTAIHTMEDLVEMLNLSGLYWDVSNNEIFIQGYDTDITLQLRRTVTNDK